MAVGDVVGTTWYEVSVGWSDALMYRTSDCPMTGVFVAVAVGVGGWVLVVVAFQVKVGVGVMVAAAGGKGSAEGRIPPSLPTLRGMPYPGVAVDAPVGWYFPNAPTAAFFSAVADMVCASENETEITKHIKANRSFCISNLLGLRKSTFYLKSLQA